MRDVTDERRRVFQKAEGPGPEGQGGMKVKGSQKCVTAGIIRWSCKNKQLARSEAGLGWACKDNRRKTWRAGEWDQTETRGRIRAADFPAAFSKGATGGGHRKGGASLQGRRDPEVHHTRRSPSFSKELKEKRIGKRALQLRTGGHHADRSGAKHASS